MGGKRRERGKRDKTGETKWNIIKYAFYNGGSFNEPNLRDHLREEFNIRAPKGIKNHLKDLEERGILRKNPSRGLSNLWDVNTDLVSIKKMIDLDGDESERKNRISELQRHDFILESIYEKYEKYIVSRGNLIRYLSFSPTFFKRFVESDPQTVYGTIEKYSASSEIRQIDDLFYSAYPFEGGAVDIGSTTNLQDDRDRRYFEKIKTLIKREIALCLFCKYSLMTDLMKNPGDEGLIKNLDTIEEMIYSYNTTLRTRAYHNIYNLIGIKDKEKRRDIFRGMVWGRQAPHIKYLEEIDSRVLKESIEAYKKRREKGRRERKEEEYKVESEEEEGIPIEKVEELLPKFKPDEEYCREEEIDEEYSKEEYEYIIPSDYPSHLGNESKMFFMFEEGKTPEDIERAGICDITEAKKYWEKYLYLTNEDNWDEIMEKALCSFLEWVDAKSKVPSQERMEGKN
jgi:hypothetical protein